MFYWLSQSSDTLSVLRALRYITFRTGGAIFTAGIFVFLLGPMIINRLRLRQGRGQPIRPDGRQSPTMSGLMILTGFIVSTVLWANPRNPYVWVVPGLALGFLNLKWR
jgi:phospho-N-acetylmuramoyl-pentapeptide-transferase